MTKSVRFANFIILSAISLVGAFLVYEIFNYHLRTGSLRAILYYYGLPIIALLLLTGLWHTRDDLKVNLSLSMISVAITLYIIEFGLILLQPEPEDFITLRSAKADASGVVFDRRTKLELLQDLRRENQDVWLSYFPGSHLNLHFMAGDQEIFPLGGISRVTSILCNELGEYTIYTSDEHGFHNPLGLYDSNSLDIVALGDSYTQGACVPSQKNTVAHIRNIYPRTLNLGISGNGPLLELATFYEYAEPLRPNIILWFYYAANDLDDLSLEYNNKLLKNYLQPNGKQNLTTIQSEIDTELKDFVLAAEKRNEEETQISNKPDIIRTIILSRLRSKLNLRFKNDRTLFYVQNDDLLLEERYALFQQILETVNDKTSSWNGKLYFVYLPEYANFNQPNYVNIHQARVTKIVHQLDIPMIDIYTTFQAHPDPLSLFPFRLNGHYTEAGYQLVAETVLATLKQDSVLADLQ